MDVITYALLKNKMTSGDQAVSDEVDLVKEDVAEVKNDLADTNTTINGMQTTIGDIQTDVGGKIDSPTTAGTSGQVLAINSDGDTSWQTYIGSVITETVSGTEVTITAEANHCYICGEVTSVNFTPCSEGLCDLIFTSGNTAASLTLPNTVLMPEWFEVDTNHIYEISITNGIYGAVMEWAMS